MTIDANHPRHGIDEHLSAPIRLSIIAALVRVDEADFKTLRDAIEVSDSVLSKQASVLEAAGYISARKGYVGKRPRTWLSVTAAGRTALATHLVALRAIVDDL